MVWCARQSNNRITHPACLENIVCSKESWRITPKSVLSGSRKKLKKSNTSGTLARSQRLEAKPRKGKFKVEKQFLEQEHKMWKLHILQEIYIAEAEKKEQRASQKPLIDSDEKNNDKDKI